VNFKRPFTKKKPPPIFTRALRRHACRPFFSRKAFRNNMNSELSRLFFSRGPPPSQPPAAREAANSETRAASGGSAHRAAADFLPPACGAPVEMRPSGGSTGGRPPHRARLAEGHSAAGRLPAVIPSRAPHFRAAGHLAGGGETRGCRFGPGYYLIWPHFHSGRLIPRRMAF